MIVVNDRFCPQNHACPAAAACPQGAIAQESILSAPRIDYDLCTECRICTKACRVFQYVPDEDSVSVVGSPTVVSA